MQTVPTTAPYVTAARQGCLVLASLFTFGIVAQIFSAGMSVLVDPQWLALHRALPPFLLLLGFCLVAFGVIGRMPRPVLVMSGVLLALVVAQWLFLLVPLGIGVPALRGLHALNALALFRLSLALIERGRPFLRTATPPPFAKGITR